MVNFLLELIGWSVDAVSTAFITAIRWMVRGLLVIALTTGLLLLASFAGSEKLAALFLWTLIAEIAIFCVIVVPVVSVLKMNQKVADVTERTWRTLASILFWLFCVGLVVTVFMSWGKPQYAPILVVALIITALAHWTCDMQISAKLAVYRSWLIVFAIIVAIALPSLNMVVKSGLGIIDDKIREKSWPQQIAFSSDLIFFDLATGKPRYWYCECDPENLFTNIAGRGFHPKTGEELKPLMPEIKDKFEKRWRDRRERERQSELEKQREQQRQEAQTAAAPQQLEEEKQKILAETRAKAEAEIAEIAKERQRLTELRLREEQKGMEKAEEMEKTTRPTEERKVETVQAPVPTEITKEERAEERKTGRPQLTRSSRSSRQPVPRKPIELPSLTSITVSVDDRLTTKSSKSGDEFNARLNGPVVIDDQEILPSSTQFRGRVECSVPAGKVKGRAKLCLGLTQILLGSEAIEIETEQLVFESGSSVAKDIGRIAGGAGIGALVGVLTGGKKGAAIGAGAGAGAGTAATVLTRGNAVEVEPEAVLTFRLAKSVTVRRASS